MMQTLYDLLGALPKDSAEDLRAAFRRAVKGAHPDLHPGDPDAALRFREIVRASEILGDAEQREAYDHLLDLAHLEEVSTSGRATAARSHKLAAGVIALAGVSAMTAGGYMLLMHMSTASVIPAGKAPHTVYASASVSPTPVTGDRSAFVARGAGPDIPAETIRSNVTLGKTDAANIPAADIGPATELASNRGDNFDRLRKFERAFADVEPTDQPERPRRAKAASTMAGMPRFGRGAIPPSVVPLPRQRPVAQDPSRLESAALMRPR